MNQQRAIAPGLDGAPDGLAPADFVQSLAKGLALIRAFGSEARSLTASEAAARIGVTRAAARRLLLTLVALGYARQTGKRFALGPQTLELARAFLSSVSWIDAARGPMERVASALQETCSLAMLDGDEIVFVQRVEATSRLVSLHVRVGTRMPALNTSSGRAIAGHLDLVEQERLLSVPFEAMSPAALRDPQALREKLREARRDGYAIVDEEMEAGMRSISAPILDAGGRPLGALAMLSQSGRATVEDLRALFAPKLVQAAADVARAVSV